jgi:hypothetical protein
MKQTAVEWLADEMKCMGIIVPKESSEKLLELMFKAKEMEKKKLEQFYNHGQWAIIEHGHGEMFEDYYNRTFKSE